MSLQVEPVPISKSTFHTTGPTWTPSFESLYICYAPYTKEALESSRRPVANRKGTPDGKPFFWALFFFLGGGGALFFCLLLPGPVLGSTSCFLLLYASCFLFFALLAFFFLALFAFCFFALLVLCFFALLVLCFCALLNVCFLLCFPSCLSFLLLGLLLAYALPLKP